MISLSSPQPLAQDKTYRPLTRTLFLGIEIFTTELTAYLQLKKCSTYAKELLELFVEATITEQDVSQIIGRLK